jgi:hypothetical protein
MRPFLVDFPSKQPRMEARASAASFIYLVRGSPRCSSGRTADRPHPDVRFRSATFSRTGLPSMNPENRLGKRLIFH